MMDMEEKRDKKGEKERRRMRGEGVPAVHSMWAKGGGAGIWGLVQAPLYKEERIEIEETTGKQRVRGPRARALSALSRPCKGGGKEQPRRPIARRKLCQVWILRKGWEAKSW